MTQEGRPLDSLSMSLDAPRICDYCGENVHTYGHKPTCRDAHLDYPAPDKCSDCGANTAFEWETTEGWLSVCCAARPINVDVEAPE